MLEQSLCFIIKTQDLGSQHVDLRRSGVAVDEGAVGGGDHHRSPHRDIILVGILHESRCDSSWLLTHVPSSLHVPRSDLLHVRWVPVAQHRRLLVGYLFVLVLVSWVGWRVWWALLLWRFTCFGRGRRRLALCDWLLLLICLVFPIPLLLVGLFLSFLFPIWLIRKGLSVVNLLSLDLPLVLSFSSLLFNVRWRDLGLLLMVPGPSLLPLVLSPSPILNLLDLLLRLLLAGRPFD